MDEKAFEEKSAKFNKVFELVVAILLGITAVITAATTSPTTRVAPFADSQFIIFLFAPFSGC